MADTKHTYTDEQLANGRRKLQAFHSWFEDNRDAYAFGERFAMGTLDAGQHTSGRAVVEHIRRADAADKRGNKSRPNNDYAAIIARKFLREHPQYAGRMELRPCVFDVLMAGGGTDA